MAENFKFKGKKKVKTWLRKAMLYGVLPAYLSILVVCGAFMFGFSLSSLPDRTVNIVFYVSLSLLAAGTILVAVLIPVCRVKQAMLDLKNYDFSPYAPKETETFSDCVQSEKYYFAPSHFDDDEGTIELSNGKAVFDYFEQFTPERLKMVEPLQDGGAFTPFYIFDLGKTYFQGSVEKRREGEYVTVTVTEKPEITFTQDGVHLGEEIFPYETCEAFVSAGFIQPYARFSANVTIVLSEECAAVFTFGTRIISIIDSHKIHVQNRDIADLILADPKKAFKRLGLRGKLKSKNK